MHQAEDRRSLLQIPLPFSCVTPYRYTQELTPGVQPQLQYSAA